MIDFRDYWTNNKIFISLISLFSIVRLYLGMNLPIWVFPSAIFDDILMFDYSHLTTHFSNWSIQSLSKDMGYPIFLCFVRLSQISYKFWLVILWIIAAILVIYWINKFLTKNKTVLLLSYLFVLFLPVAFDVLCGQRVYRNAIIAPITIIFLSLLYIFINNLLDSSQNIKNLLVWGILLGLTFTFNYYIKEDGILTLPILVITILSVLLYKIFKENKLSFSKQNLNKTVKLTIICAIPLLIFVGGTLCYQEVNNHYFGVSEVNTRTSGELGDFYANLLKIDDSNKTTEIWVPASTVEKAVSASPTLQSQPKFIDAWLDTPWNGGTLRDSAIRGDLAAWSLRSALNKSGLYENEKSTNDFFFKVNNELNSAFDSGALNRTDEIFITSSANAKNINEIFALEPYVLSGMDMTFFYNGFEFNNVNNDKTSYFITNEVTKNVSRDIHDSLVLQTNLDHLSPLEIIPIKLIGMDMAIYQVISHFVVLIAFAAFLFTCYAQYKNKFKDKNMNMLILFNIIVLGTVLVQIFAVAWFCSYLGTNPWVGSMNDLVTHIKFHLVSAYGFFTMFVVLSIVGAYSIIDKYELKN